MEYGGLDLGRLIKNIKRIAGWVEHHVRFLSWQILAGLNYLHSANIAHRVRHGGRGYDSKQYLTVPTWLDLSVLTVTTYASDLLPAALLYAQDLKPSNILVTEDNHVSLIDFGLARQLRAIAPPTAAAKPALDKNLALQNNRKHTQHVVRSLFYFRLRRCCTCQWPVFALISLPHTLCNLTLGYPLVPSPGADYSAGTIHRCY